MSESSNRLDLIEGCCTGVPANRGAMRRNGSPPPRFETGDGRTYIFVELPIHPEFHPDHGPRKAHDQAHDGLGELSETERRIVRALRHGPRSVPEILADLGHGSLSGAVKNALRHLDELGLIALTIPEKPRSRNQKRQLTIQGQRAIQGG